MIESTGLLVIICVVSSLYTESFPGRLNSILGTLHALSETSDSDSMNYLAAPQVFSSPLQGDRGLSSSNHEENWEEGEMQGEPWERKTLHLTLHMQKVEMETRFLDYLSVQLLYIRGKKHKYSDLPVFH